MMRVIYKNETLLSWSRIEAMTKNIAKKIKNDNLNISFVLSLNRGGLIPGVLISHMLKIKHAVMTIQSYNGKHKTKKVRVDSAISALVNLDPRHVNDILLLDDTADSGDSLIAAKKKLVYFGYNPKKIHIATLLYKNKSLIRPDYYAISSSCDHWFVFPWEKEHKL